LTRCLPQLATSRLVEPAARVGVSSGRDPRPATDARSQLLGHDVRCWSRPATARPPRLGRIPPIRTAWSYLEPVSAQSG